MKKTEKRRRNQEKIGDPAVAALIRSTPELAGAEEAIRRAIDVICRAFEKGKKLFVAGNGGSMSDALHISGELLKGFRIRRRGFRKNEPKLQPGVPVWVLGINPSLSSAVDNDFPEPYSAFAQELYAAGTQGDVLLGISTSGQARNLRRAFETARRMGITSVSLTGIRGGSLSETADIAVRTPGGDTAEIQEYHVKVYHALCTAIEERLFGERGSLTGPYGSRHPTFDFRRISTYSLSERENRTDLERLIPPDSVTPRRSEDQGIKRLAEAAADSCRRGSPVVLMMGAHLIKNGLGPLVADLIDRGVITLVAGNGACPIHDAELALCGGTSERVPEALPAGRFGFAAETGELINAVYAESAKRLMGAGEALGAILAGDIPLAGTWRFPYRDHSIYYRAYRKGIPATIHATIGTDIVDQHPDAAFDAKGYGSGVDFSIFAQAMTRFIGGVVIDVGGAVTQPEVLLKAVSMAANIGKPPQGFVAAVFDMVDVDRKDAEDESKPGYYRRDIKSIVVRIPAAFGGEGLYIRGDQKVTFPAFYGHVRCLLESPVDGKSRIDVKGKG